MALQARAAGRRRPAQARRALPPIDRELAWVVAVALASRLAVWAVAAFAALLATGSESPGSIGRQNELRFDDPRLTHPFGSGVDLALAPMARWDAVWYLRIAGEGYGADPGLKAAFFPLYPLLVRALGIVLGGGPGGRLIASYAIALFAFVAAACVVYRLVRERRDRATARLAIVLLCAFPGSLWFGAPYAESLFLAAAAASLAWALQGRLWLAAAAGGLAAATRPVGVLLVLPLALVWWQRWRAGSALTWHALALLLVPAGIAAFAVLLAAGGAPALAFVDVQSAWARQTVGPLAGVWRAFEAAWLGVRQLASGSREVVYFGLAAGDPLRIAAMNVMLFAFLLAALGAMAVSWRRVPVALWLWALAVLAFALSVPAVPQPLMSLPRFLGPLFPLAWGVAVWARERRADAAVVVSAAVVLGAFAALYGSWNWIG